MKRDNSKAYTSAAARSEFMIAVLSMSWQLAVVVLIPVVTGFKLDEFFNTLPLLTIIGFMIAMTGVFLVLKRTLDDLARRTAASSTISAGSTAHTVQPKAKTLDSKEAKR